jgi:hypothetical protein
MVGSIEMTQNVPFYSNASLGAVWKSISDLCCILNRECSDLLAACSMIPPASVRSAGCIGRQHLAGPPAQHCVSELAFTNG